MKNVRLEALPHAQDYRKRLKDIIAKADPAAEIVDPLEHVGAWAAAAGLPLNDYVARESIAVVFGRVVELAAACDVVISNLPEASMGSAVEIWEAKKAGRGGGSAKIKLKITK